MRIRLALNRCCCDEEYCTPYLPCCIRDIIIKCRIDVDRTTTDSYVYTKNFTLTNHCNDQESPDWSTWERVGPDTAGDGDENWSVSGINNQGCTFSIDILHEHLFCSCGTKNFTSSLTLANPTSDDGGDTQPGSGDADVTVDNISMAVYFDNPLTGTACALEMKTASSFNQTMTPGSDWTVNFEFGTADWTACFPNCLERSNVIVEDDTYLTNDVFDTTCIMPVFCLPSDFDYEGQSYQRPEVEECIAALCPPCGCVLDHEETNPDPAFVSSSSAAGTGAVDPGLPIGVEHNDILILVVNGEGEDANSDDAPSDPAIPAAPGYQYWTPIDDPDDGSIASGTDGDPARTRATVYWCRYDEDRPPSTAVPDAGTYTLAVITAWRNCKVADHPINAWQSSSSASADVSVSISGLTTTVNNCLIVNIETAGDDVTVSGWTNAGILGLTENVDENTAVGSSGHIGIASGRDTTAGLLAATTATVSEAEQEANWMIAVEPAESTWAEGSDCQCGCGIQEARRACKFPKELANGTGNGGEITICMDTSAGNAQADGWVVSFMDGNNRVGGIWVGTVASYRSWRYIRTGGPSPSQADVTIQSIDGNVFPDCDQFVIEWQMEEDESLTLTVNGVTDSTTKPGGGFSYDPPGDVWVTAQRGSTFSTVSI